jgi:hypothetical protein
MFKTIIQLLNGDREISFSRQSAATNETNESSETKIPFKFKADIEALQRLYPAEDDVMMCYRICEVNYGLRYSHYA